MGGWVWAGLTRVSPGFNKNTGTVSVFDSVLDPVSTAKDVAGADVGKVSKGKTAE